MEHENYEGRVFGGYKLEKMIGEGSYGHVYSARKNGGPLVAIKILAPRQDKRLRCVENEVLKELVGNDNIVRHKDFGFENTIPFIVMEYISGDNLRKRFNKIHSGEAEKRGINIDNTIISCIQQIAKALQSMHDKGIIHCDLRPEHILLEKGDTAFLCDFGLALYNGHSDNKSSDKRTPEYMAPEQLSTDPNPCPASDQFALAVILYEWLCGVLPFTGTQEEIITLHSDVDKLKMSDYTPTIPAKVELAIKKALAQKEKDRYGSVQEFADKLAEAYETSKVRFDSYEPTVKSKKTQKGWTRRDLIHDIPKNFIDFLPIGITIAALVASSIKIIPKVYTTFYPSIAPTPAPSASTLTTLYVYHGHTKNVNAVAWFKDGKRIASASDDGTIQIWDIANGDNLITLLFNSLGSTFIATTATGDNLAKYNKGNLDSMNDVAWSPDGKYLAFCYGNKVVVYDVAAPRFFPPLATYSDIAKATSWSFNNQKYSLTAASYNGTVHVWELDNHPGARWRQIYKSSLPFNARIIDVALSHDGKYIALCTDTPHARVYVIQIDSGSIIFTSPEHSDGISSLDWSPLNQNKEAVVFGLTSTSGNVIIVNPFIGTENTFSSLSAKVSIVSWSPNGKYIAAGEQEEGIVHIWSALDSSINLPYTEHRPRILSSQGPLSINALAWSPDGHIIASGGTDGTVRIWKNYLP